MDLLSSTGIFSLSCLGCKRTFTVFATFELEGAATYCHCPDCVKLIKLWGKDDYFISNEEEAFL